MSRNLVHISSRIFNSGGDTVSLVQMQAIAQRNQLESHQADGYQDMTGLTVTLGDLCAADPHGRHGSIRYMPQLEAMAARVGAVIQRTGDSAEKPGDWSRSSYFVYPAERKITPHKGGRTIKKSTDVTPETAEMLAKLDISLGDLVEEAVRARYAQTGA